MKLTIVNCGRPGSYAVVKYQALAPAYLAAYTPPDWDVELVDENFQTFDADDCSADLVAFSALPIYIDRAYRYAAVLKDRGIATVGGGLHVSAVPAEALEHFDAIVEGEAEPVWGQVLADFEGGRLQRHYASHFDNSLNDLRLPDRQYIHPSYKLASLSTSRGCMNRCTFCYMGSLARKSYRVIPTERIVEDFRQVIGRFVVFSDANFLGFSDEDIDSRKELCARLAELRLRRYWAAQVTADIIKHPDLPRLLHRAGCRMAFVGFETIDEDGLGSIDKPHNFNIDYLQVVRTLQDAGIGVAASFILGLDTHGPDYERAIGDWLDLAQPLFLNLGVLTPMPNTALYRKLHEEGRLLGDGVELWRHLDKATNTMRYRHLTGGEMEEMFARINSRFFRPGNIARNFLEQLVARRRPLLAALYLGAALRKRESGCKSAVFTPPSRSDPGAAV